MPDRPKSSWPNGTTRQPGEFATQCDSNRGEGAALESTRATDSPQPEAGNERSEEQHLVAAVLRKDRKATAEFVSRFADAVYSYVYWRLAPAVDAVDDLTQDVFLEAWRSLERYRGEGGLSAWMVGIARHKVQDHYRRSLKSVEFPEDPDETPSGLPPLEEIYFEQQRDERILAVMAELPEMYRVVLLWRYWEGKSATDIAQSIGRTPKAVERLLARARQQFREHYQENR